MLRSQGWQTSNRLRTGKFPRPALTARAETRMSSPMTGVRITSGEFKFLAHFETAAAPRTSARFEALLPYRQKIIHVRWSGEACWIPLGDLDLGLGPESATSYPAPGQILLYPGGVSET